MWIHFPRFSLKSNFNLFAFAEYPSNTSLMRVTTMIPATVSCREKVLIGLCNDSVTQYPTTFKNLLSQELTAISRMEMSRDVWHRKQTNRIHQTETRQSGIVFARIDKPPEFMSLDTVRKSGVVDTKKKIVCSAFQITPFVLRHTTLVIAASQKESKECI